MKKIYFKQNDSFMKQNAEEEAEKKKSKNKNKKINKQDIWIEQALGSARDEQ